MTMFRSAVLTATLLAAAGAAPALAADTGSTLGVSATVTENCVVSTTPVAFGNVDVTTGAAVEATGGISVTCTSGTGWSAAADVGSGTNATLASRKMASGTDLLNYGLYTDSGRTSLWGDGVGGSTATIDGTGTGSAQAHTIYGRIFASQAALPAGSYADTVTVTVTY